jgi:NAD(P)-dependent dehydrogenase (short-subunit alcohol dehydrogenase family)
VLFIREIDLDKSERILAILFEKEVSRTIVPTICQSVNLVIRDVAWNSLGRATLDRIDTEDGFELAMATNYLGPFTLTHLLLDKVGVAKKRKSS